MHERIKAGAASISPPDEDSRRRELFHKPNATGLPPWLYATTLPLLTFSCVSLGAQQPPWEGCRAASKTEYESAKRDFLLQTSIGAYATTGHWWRRYYWYCHL
jgi:hypothetical protein